MAVIKEQVEDRIIDCISLGSGGRLVIFKPEGLNRDLVVEKKNDYKKKKIILDVYVRPEMPKRVSNPAENFYLLIVGFDEVRQELEDDFLVMPSLDVTKGKKIKQKEFPLFLLETIGKK